MCSTPSVPPNTFFEIEVFQTTFQNLSGLTKGTIEVKTAIATSSYTWQSL